MYQYVSLHRHLRELNIQLMLWPMSATCEPHAAFADHVHKAQIVQLL